MWLVRELLRLVVRVAIAFVIALALAALWAAVSEHGFVHDLRTTCLVLGVIALGMGAIGRGSNFERAMDFGVTRTYWGRVPGMSTLQRTGEDPTLTPGAVFFLTGLALLALAVFVL